MLYKKCYLVAIIVFPLLWSLTVCPQHFLVLSFVPQSSGVPWLVLYAQMQVIAANLHFSCKEKQLQIKEDLQGGIISWWNV